MAQDIFRSAILEGVELKVVAKGRHSTVSTGIGDFSASVLARDLLHLE